VKPYPVLIEWVDACDWSPGEWVDLEPLKSGHATGCDVITVGWLVQKSKRALVLALSISEADDGRGLFVIPTACVTTMTRLSPRP
jgi:hypothetical protein